MQQFVRGRASIDHLPTPRAGETAIRSRDPSERALALEGTPPLPAPSEPPKRLRRGKVEENDPVRLPGRRPLELGQPPSVRRR